MHLTFRRLASLALACASFGPFAACHALAAPDAPRSGAPSIEIDVEDRGADKATHGAHFTMGTIEGKALLTARDGEAEYEIDARLTSSTDPTFTIKLKRSERNISADILLLSAVPQKAGPRVLLAKIDRADGRMTTVSAQVR